MSLSERYDGFLIDLDGVVWLGREPVPGSIEALRTLGAAGVPFAFVTNNPGRPAATYARHLREAGVEVGDDAVVTAGEAAARLASDRLGGAGSAFVIGAEALHDEVAAAGLEPLRGEAGREADLVLVSGHRGFDYEELLTATLALAGGAELVATSRDPTLPMPGAHWPGTGSILAAVETASGARAEIAGKPEPHLFALGRERLGGAARVAMIGDRPASDIAGGAAAGLDTILVLSGATAAEDADRAEPQADHVVADLAAVVSG